MKEYIERVKRSNPNGVVLCIDTEEGTQEKIKTDGAFNVYVHMNERVFVDFLGKGFDMGAITKGKEVHEAWNIEWNELLFIKPNNMNQCRTFKVTNEDYLQSARRRLQHLLNIGYSPEAIRGNIPKNYMPMPNSTKEMILDDILWPLYANKEKLKAKGLNSFGVQGMVIKGELFPIEINRQERFATKEFWEKDDQAR